MTRDQTRLAVLKLGGAQARGGRLGEWLDAIAAPAGRHCRRARRRPVRRRRARRRSAEIGFDDAAAHEMAMMAMSQFGRALASLRPGFEIAASEAAHARRAGARRAPIWSPERMALAAGCRASWDLTSDSLAAWLAGTARRRAAHPGQTWRRRPAAAGTRPARRRRSRCFPPISPHPGPAPSSPRPTAPDRLGEGLDGAGLRRDRPRAMSEHKTPRWAWAITGSGHYIKETFALVRELRGSRPVPQQGGGRSAAHVQAGARRCRNRRGCSRTRPRARRRSGSSTMASITPSSSPRRPPTRWRNSSTAFPTISSATCSPTAARRRVPIDRVRLRHRAGTVDRGAERHGEGLSAPDRPRKSRKARPLRRRDDGRYDRGASRRRSRGGAPKFRL